MKKFFNIVFAILLAIPLVTIGAANNERHHGEDHHEEEGHEHHGGGKALGAGKAVTEVDEKKGFKLSKEAFDTIGVRLASASGRAFLIPESALVVSNENKGVYRFRNGFFKLVRVENVKKIIDGYEVEVLDLFKESDQIAVGGVRLLKVSDIYSTDESEYGHGH